MATLGIRQLKSGLSAAVKRVRDGEEITITDHGRPVARIVPLEEPELSDHIRDLIRAGKIEYRRFRPELIGPGIKLKPGKKTAAEIVSDQRG